MVAQLVRAPPCHGGGRGFESHSLRKLMSKSKKNKKDFLKKYFNFYSIILIILIVWGLFLRLHSLSQEPYWIDEGYTINGILSIKEHNSLILDSGETYRCPIYCKATSYITNILGDNAFSYRLLAAVSGTLLILIVYFTTKKIINKHVALLSTFFITFAHYEIA